MNLKNVTNNWVDRNLTLILDKENKLDERLMLNFLENIPYELNVETVGNSLFNSMLDKVIPFYLNKKEDPEFLINKVSQVSLFCKLGEYGSYTDWDF